MEKRTARRQRVFKSAIIEFPGGAFSCVVRNFSDLGANLDVPSASGIPHEFTLVIPSAQSQLSCRAVWRSERRIGVAFSWSSSWCWRLVTEAIWAQAKTLAHDPATRW